MPYNTNKKSTGLDVLTTLASGDLHIVGDVSDSGRAKAITEDNLETTIANSTNFTDALIANTNFTTDLANDTNFTTTLGNNSSFVSTLTSNSTFQSSVNSFVTGGGGGGGGTKLAIDTTAFTHTGDTTETTAYTVAIPAGTLGTNNAIRFYLLGSSDGNSANVTYRVKYGASTVASIVDTSGTNADIILDGTITADSLTNAQISSARLNKAGNVSQSTDGTDSTEDSTTALNLVVTIQNASAGATTSFKGIIVESISNLADGVSFVAVANQDLTAGQTVGISSLGGGVAIASKAKSAFSLADTGASAEYAELGGDRIFILYKVNGTTTLKGVVGTINRDTMTLTVGTAVTYTTGLQGDIYAVNTLSTDKVAVMYTEGGTPTNIKLHVSTIATSTITVGSQQAFATTANTVQSLITATINTDKAVVYTREASTPNETIRAFNVSGTTLGTVGTGVACLRVTSMVSHTTDAFTMVGYIAGTADDGIQVGTVSTLAITLGSEVTVNTVNTNPADNAVCVVNTTTVVMTYRGAPGRMVRGVSISGTTPTLGTAVSTGLGGSDTVLYDANRQLVMYGLGRFYSISGTTLTIVVGGIGSDWAGTGSGGVSNFVNMGTYFAVPSVTPSGNYITIQGMSTTFLPGFVAQNVSRGGNAIITIKGKISGFTNLIPGNKYIADGTGGLTLDNTNGIATAITDTTLTL